MSWVRSGKQWLFISFQYPGPNEEGLQWQRDMVERYPYCALGWMGPIYPMVLVNHPETVKTILKTSGENDTERLSQWLSFENPLTSALCL